MAINRILTEVGRAEVLLRMALVAAAGLREAGTGCRQQPHHQQALDHFSFSLLFLFLICLSFLLLIFFLSLFSLASSSSSFSSHRFFTVGSSAVNQKASESEKKEPHVSAVSLAYLSLLQTAENTPLMGGIAQESATSTIR